MQEQANQWLALALKQALAGPFKESESESEPEYWEGKPVAELADSIYRSHLDRENQKVNYRRPKESPGDSGSELLATNTPDLDSKREWTLSKYKTFVNKCDRFNSYRRGGLLQPEVFKTFVGLEQQNIEFLIDAADLACKHHQDLEPKELGEKLAELLTKIASSHDFK